ncbi:hypothetical protein H4219_001179 [Mycoemilia scoparia]|uniref:Micro-fibrillar-associated protein 1 C-terminal domain-containing protein n=1 Tax=Mycoemilia scoparia TaxID=417184 RepID=A0A9W8DS47_9FUNG|nr:hypothetical protein H4219_001179 [Mycoemilia scoparia]
MSKAPKSSASVVTSGTKIRRYFPGKAPESAVDLSASSESESEHEPRDTKDHGKEQQGHRHIGSEEHSSDSESSIDSDQDDNKQPSTASLNVSSARRREYSSEESESESNDEENSRAALRRKALLKRRQEEKELEKEVSESEDASGDDSEEESSTSQESSDESESSGDDIPTIPMIKPVFIPKNKRNAVPATTKEDTDDYVDATLEDKLKAQTKRREESKRMAAEQVKHEMTVPDVDDINVLEVDDTDGIDEEAEYNAWKLRELKRIKAYKEERMANELEEKERERRANMTEEERLREDMELARQKREEKNLERGAKGSSERYYHKGAFYQDIDERLLKRTVYTGDSSVLKNDQIPDIAKAKNFGRSGRTKWTTLKKEDTSVQDSLWDQDRRLSKRALEKMGGLKDNVGSHGSSSKKRR